MGTGDGRHIGSAGDVGSWEMWKKLVERKGGPPSFPLDEPPRHIRLTVTRIG